MTPSSEEPISLCTHVTFKLGAIEGGLVAHLRRGLVVYWVFFTNLVGTRGHHFNCPFVGRSMEIAHVEENTY